MINSTLYHATKETFHVVTGQDYDAFPQSDGTIVADTLPSKGTIPIAVQRTGTISSTDEVVRGTGTKFLTELKVDDCLYDGDVVRRIRNIYTDTLLEITHGFPSDLSGANILHCERGAFFLVQWNCSGTAAAVLQGAPLPVGEKGLNSGDPLAYDASASNAQISFTCSR